MHVYNPVEVALKTGKKVTGNQAPPDAACSGPQAGLCTAALVRGSVLRVSD